MKASMVKVLWRLTMQHNLSSERAAQSAHGFSARKCCKIRCASCGVIGLHHVVFSVHDFWEAFRCEEKHILARLVQLFVKHAGRRDQVPHLHMSLWAQAPRTPAQERVGRALHQQRVFPKRVPCRTWAARSLLDKAIQTPPPQELSAVCAARTIWILGKTNCSTDCNCGNATIFATTCNWWNLDHLLLVL